jgi:hypothetical protein
MNAMGFAALNPSYGLLFPIYIFSIEAAITIGQENETRDRLSACRIAKEARARANE